MLGQRDLKVVTKDHFIFGGWFASKRSYEATMVVGDLIIDMLENNTNCFCKDNTKNIKME